MGKFKPNIPNYIRVGTDYFKIILKRDRFGIQRTELKKWNKDEIKQDHVGSDKYYLDKVPKYDDFIIEPDNNGMDQAMDNCYNMYSQFPHTPDPGQWPWTFILLKHIFGTQFKVGMIYLQVLYRYPKQALPILALVSEERQTGKSTFLDWLNMIFGANMVMIEPDVIGSTFNSEYATSNIIAIDETILDKQITVEKIKSLATKKFISVNMKNISQFKLPFFGKIILASNNEDKFMRIDSKEIRFWVRRISTPPTENHRILEDMVPEIPAFLYYLTTMKDPDFTKSRMVLTEKQIRNEFLDIVKKESMSHLYKELLELITDWFDNNNFIELELIPADIKKRWFNHNNTISISYIRRVLKVEFLMNAKNTTKKYNPFGNEDQRTGRIFTFKRGDYNDTPISNEEDEIPF